jgi:hypothetical protein
MKAALICAAVAASLLAGSLLTGHRVWQAAPVCSIKGNVSQRTGERIYHVRGQRYYDKTIIDEGKGERWFCSEQAARAVGWRKAKL